MTADGFLNQKQRHPVALTAAIAINAAAIAAVMLAKSVYVVIPPGAIPIINITEPPVPDPIDEVKPDVPKSKRPVYVPPRPFPSDQPADDIFSDTSGDPVTGAGTESEGLDQGTVVRAEPKPVPIPVLTDATPLPGAARDFQPPYPLQLLRTGVEGKAVVRVLVGADGRVKQVAVISADDPLFADATERQARRKWRFRPATRDGAPVEAWKQLTVRFEIR